MVEDLYWRNLEVNRGEINAIDFLPFIGRSALEFPIRGDRSVLQMVERLQTADILYRQVTQIKDILRVSGKSGTL